MQQILKEIGWKKCFGFFFSLLHKAFFSFLFFPPLRSCYLKFWGSQMGKSSIIHKIQFINLYRMGFKGLSLGKNCFLADGVLLDLADQIWLGNNVTVAARAMILTHTNVGFKNHPLQKRFPKFSKQVKIKDGCFIGAGAIILPGVTVGENSFVAAGAVVTKNVSSHSLVGGAPAKLIRKIK